MDKNNLLQEIKNLVKDGSLTKSELLDAYHDGLSGANGEKKHKGVATIFYYIGGLIVLIGVVVLVGQNWLALNDATKILATLGSAAAAYIAGAIFIRYKNLDGLAQSFFGLAAVLAPLGIMVTFDISGLSVEQSGIQSLISAIALATFLGSFFIYKKTVFLIFSILFGTWFYFSLTQLLFAQNIALESLIKSVEYRILLAGLSYIFLGYYFANRRFSDFFNPSGWLYGVGLLGFLGSALALGGWQPNQNIFWEVIFPGLALGSVISSVYLKSRSCLVFGSLFLIAYIFKITGEYFADSLGWPLVLVISGLALIGVGYSTLYLNRKYFSS